MANSDQNGSNDTTGLLIGGLYSVDFEQSIPQYGAGLRCFAASDRSGRRRDLIALQMPPDLPPHPAVLASFASPVPMVPCPLGFGAARGPDGREVAVVIGEAPRGEPLSPTPLPLQGQFTRWDENSIIEHVLIPVARSLEALRALHVTHRAIRPDNLFHSSPGEPVTLGPFWGAAPAAHQPAIYEPPYVAMCPPAGRGSGSTGDDVYALGVTMIVLACGRAPLAGLTDEQIILRKLERGSFAALTADVSLPPLLLDLLRGMLAEDPDHRSTPALLADPTSARARRIASRPRPRAAKALKIGSMSVIDQRVAAYAMARDPEAAASVLRSKALDAWLRRSLADANLTLAFEDVVRRCALQSGSSGDTDLTMQTIALLDPLAPLCWRGLAVWPDAIGSMLAGCGPADTAKIEEIVAAESMGAWASLRPERCNVGGIKLDSRQFQTMLRQPGWAGGVRRLRYSLHPLVRLASPLVEGHVVMRLADLLPAMEARGSNGGQLSGLVSLDRDTCAFIASRSDRRVENEITAISGEKGASESTLAVLRLLADLQQRSGAGTRLPRICTWLAPFAATIVETWRNKPRRDKIAAALVEVTATGQLPAMLALLDDRESRAIDQSDGAAADAEVAAIDGELSRIAAGAATHPRTAQQVGTEIAAALGAAAFFAVVVALAVS